MSAKRPESTVAEGGMNETEPSLAPRVTHIRSLLLAWFATHRRPLPWRNHPDPYAVWVSEIMLQQTQVATVIPYFQRWMARFPTLAALAEAPLQEVLRYWAGLGYYARARHLHAAARQVMERYGGTLPADRDALLSLPGIGRYTAGAILSIAFGVAAPILDANGARVLSRLFCVEGDPRRGVVRRRLWALAEALVEGERPGDLNQALMELGATVCTPESPSCSVCPLVEACQAYAERRVAEFPQLRPRPVAIYQEHVSAVVCHDHRLLLTQRPTGVLWAGLWEFPRAVRRPDEDLKACGQRAVRESVGVDVEGEGWLTRVRHTVTHHRITLYAMAARMLRGEPEAVGCAAWGWFRPEEAEHLPLPAPQARVLKAVQRHAASTGELWLETP